jgi:septal ring factor EnvC (AmiA/AmiB activator)
MKTILAEMRGHGVILEDIQSQSRAKFEAVRAMRAALEEKIDQVDRNSQARDEVLEAAVRQNSKDIRQNSEDIRKNSDDIRKNSEDIRVLTTRVDALGPLDQRVSALERRPSR